jgi:hypothetical protein
VRNTVLNEPNTVRIVNWGWRLQFLEKIDIFDILQRLEKINI